MNNSFDTIFEMCDSLFKTMQENENITLNALVHNVNLNFHVYRLPNDFTFDSAETVASVFSLCQAVDTATQVIIGKNITVNKGINLTPPYRCKGMIVFDYGTTINNGSISMTSRGCNAIGQDIFLYRNEDSNIYEYVPAVGAAGGNAIALNSNNTATHGNKGVDGVKRQTGGGGTGGGRRWHHYVSIGRGGNGTSYSGGSGSGAGNSDGSYGSNVYVANGSDTGGAGSDGITHASNSSGYSIVSAGGQGNPHGTWSNYRVSPSKVYTDIYGTGGLLIMYCGALINNGSIQSNGGNTMCPVSSAHNNSSGGASGGGSVNIFYFKDIIKGSCTATGGQRFGSATYYGGIGGNGCVTIMQINPIEDSRLNSNFYKNAIPNSYSEYQKYDTVCQIHQENHGFVPGDPIYYDEFYKKANIENTINVLGLVSEIIDENTFIYKNSGKISMDKRIALPGDILYLTKDGLSSTPDGIMKPVGIQLPDGIIVKILQALTRR